VFHEFANTREQIDQYTRAAIAPVIQPTLKLFNDALKQGVHVFFVTGRNESFRKMTINNLRRAGYHDWADLLLKPQHYHEKSITPFKTQAREKISQQGYVIIANIGDQASDLQGGYAEQSYKLPNPYYSLP
jgi:predicted secreted acid phosphatase